jgi:hypothetical protein
MFLSVVSDYRQERQRQAQLLGGRPAHRDIVRSIRRIIPKVERPVYTPILAASSASHSCLSPCRCRHQTLGSEC